MDSKLTTKDLASALSERYGMEAEAAESFINTVFEIIQEYIFRDKVVRVKGLGTFKLVSVSQRESVSIKTGERILIAGHSKLSFTPDANLKDIVNKPFADFETVILKDSTTTEDMERIAPVESDSSEEDTKTNPDYSTADNEDNSSDIYAESSPAENDNIPAENIVPFPDDDTILEEVDNADAHSGESEEIEDAEILDTDSSEEQAVVKPENDEEEISGTTESDSTTETEEIEETADASDAVAIDITDVQGEQVTERENLYPMASREITRSSQESSHSLRKWVYVFLTILLMVISYVGGHNNWLGNIDINLYPEEEITENPIVKTAASYDDYPVNSIMEDSATLSHDTISADTRVIPVTATTLDTVVALKDTVSAHVEESQQESPVQLEEDPAEIAKFFPQVKNGSYWIVGDAGRIHYMESGETLYRVAKKELGSQDFVRYIIIFNDFEDPNLIHTGDPIRIPKLVKK